MTERPQASPTPKIPSSQPYRLDSIFLHATDASPTRSRPLSPVLDTPDIFLAYGGVSSACFSVPPYTHHQTRSSPLPVLTLATSDISPSRIAKAEEAPDNLTTSPPWSFLPHLDKASPALEASIARAS
ncbi:hypothetical protein E2P81_ATG01875 [Venturia nashicola]|nr:hypothetical protein E2P81_ATG01875 [Venturia nashicola]